MWRVRWHRSAPRKRGARPAHHRGHEHGSGNNFEIEGETLDRASVQSSLRKQLGLATDEQFIAGSIHPLEDGTGRIGRAIAEHGPMPAKQGFFEKRLRKGSVQVNYRAEQPRPGQPMFQSISHVASTTFISIRRSKNSLRGRHGVSRTPSRALKELDPIPQLKGHREAGRSSRPQLLGRTERVCA